MSPSTLHPPAFTLHPPPSCLHPPPSTLHPPPSTGERVEVGGTSRVCGRTTSPGKLLRFRSGLVFRAHRLLYHSTLGLREIKKQKRSCSNSGLEHFRSSLPAPRMRGADKKKLHVPILVHKPTLGRFKSKFLCKKSFRAQFEPHPRTKFKNNYFAEIRSSSEEGSYLRLINLCIT